MGQSIQSLADEFLIVQNRNGFEIPICGLCNNSGTIRLVADVSGKQHERPCICANGRSIRKSQLRKIRFK